VSDNVEERFETDIYTYIYTYINTYIHTYINRKRDFLIFVIFKSVEVNICCHAN